MGSFIEITVWADESIWRKGMCTSVLPSHQQETRLITGSSYRDRHMVLFDPGWSVKNYSGNGMKKRQINYIHSCADRAFADLSHKFLSHNTAVLTSHPHEDHKNKREKLMENVRPGEREYQYFNGYLGRLENARWGPFTINSTLTSHGSIHPEDEENLGLVSMFSVDDGKHTMVYAADVGGPQHLDDAKWIASRRPNFVQVDGPYEYWLQENCPSYKVLGGNVTEEAIRKIVKKGTTGHKHAEIYLRVLDNMKFILERAEPKYLLPCHHNNRGVRRQGRALIRMLEEFSEEHGIKTKIGMPADFHPNERKSKRSWDFIPPLDPVKFVLA